MCNFFYKIDDVYCQIGAHISPTLRKRIKLGAYVDLPKLLKKVKLFDDDQKSQMVNKEGKMFFIPTTENTNISISENSRESYVTDLANDIHCNFPSEALMNTVSSYEAAYWLE